MAYPIVHTVQGSSGSPYTVKDHGTHWSCSCPAWRYKGGDTRSRICKHILTLCGDVSHQPTATTMTSRKRKTLATAVDAPSKVVNVALAQEWKGQDPTGYLLSEKLDGMRCLYDGQQLYSRNGNIIHAPAAMVRALPSMALDGELYLGRGRFQECMSIVRSQRADAGEWSEVKFMVFDAPEVIGTATERLSHAAIALIDHSWAAVVPHRVCTGEKDTMAELDRVIALGGEGIMLKHPINPYTGGRNANHLKVKRFYDDEAIVTGHEPGKGKHTGRLGALICMDAHGREFCVGTGLTDAERTNPPPVGTCITYKYQERTNAGLPRFPVFMRVRPAE